jgi:Na+/melibiose symporter-like transporter
LPETDSGIVVLCGQFADGLATPIVGIFTDKTETKFGKRTPWYIAGSILVVICFLLIFQDCFICNDNTPYSFRLIYLCIFPSLFNIAWATVQVSHMSLLPSLTLNKKKKDQMTRLRNGFTFGAQFLFLCLSLACFYFIENGVLQYQILTAITTFLGIISTIVFLINCRENVLSKNIKFYYDSIKLMLIENDEKERRSISVSDFSSSEASDTFKENEVAEEEHVDWKFWMKRIDFWVYMLVYMLVRLAINCSSTMIPFFCDQVYGFHNEDGTTPIEISIVLIIINFSSVIYSLFIEQLILKQFSSKKRRVIVFIIATICISSSCIPLFFIPLSLKNIIYLFAVFMGIGFSAGLSGASSLINDVVGPYGEKGAFVYGCYSFTDKFSCGLALFYLIHISKENTKLLQSFLSFLPPFSIICALICVYLRKSSKSAKKKKDILEDPRLIFESHD